MRLINIFVLFILVLKLAYSQQVSMLNHYFYKPFVYNPAFAGNFKAPDLMVLHHNQWTGFTGAPQYNMLSFDLPIKKTGIGVNILSDKKGLNNRTTANISYSYKLQFKENIYLRLGLWAGGVNQSFNYSKIYAQNLNDSYFYQNQQTSTSFDANAGLAFICKGLEFGFAVPQLANNKIKFKTNEQNKQAFYSETRHMMTSLAYKMVLSKEKEITLTPQVLLRYAQNAPIQYDANLNFWWQNKFWIGATYKNDYAVGLNLGVTLFKRLSLGYSYDYMIGSISKYGGLSHEIMLGFRFIKPKKEELPKLTEDEEDEKLLADMRSKSLNKLTIERILKHIEEVLEKDNPTKEEIQAINDEISAFFDQDEDNSDNMEKIRATYYKSLKKIEAEVSVLVKGQIMIEGSSITSSPDYASINITISDVGTGEIVATSSPRARDGKYFMILKPGRKYLIEVESSIYKPYSRNFSPAGSTQSYEMSQELWLKK